MKNQNIKKALIKALSFVAITTSAYSITMLCSQRFSVQEFCFALGVSILIGALIFLYLVFCSKLNLKQ